MSAPNERQRNRARALWVQLTKSAPPDSLWAYFGCEYLANALAAERDAAIEECAKVAQLNYEDGADACSAAEEIRELKSAASAASIEGWWDEALSKQEAELAVLRAKLAAAEAVVKAAKSLSAGVSDLEKAWSVCETDSYSMEELIGFLFATHPLLKAALTAYDAVGGGGVSSKEAKSEDKLEAALKVVRAARVFEATTDHEMADIDKHWLSSTIWGVLDAITTYDALCGEKKCVHQRVKHDVYRQGIADTATTSATTCLDCGEILEGRK